LPSGKAAREVGAGPAPAAAPFQRRGSAAASDGGSQWEQSGVHPAHKQSIESDYYTYTITSDSIRSSSSSSHQPGRYSDHCSTATIQQAAGLTARSSAFGTATGSAAAIDPTSGAGAAYPASISAYGSYAHGHAGQPAQFSYASSMHGPATSSAPAAAEAFVGEDSDDDAPPGFENISRAPGFLGREPARGPATAAAGLTNMPPGFEGRALRVHAALVSHPEMQQASAVPPAWAGQQPLQQSTSLGQDEQYVSLSHRLGQQPLQHSGSLGGGGQHTQLSQRLAARLGGQPGDETDRLSQPLQHRSSLDGSGQHMQLSQRLAARLGGQSVDERERLSHTVQAAAAADAAGRGSQQTRRLLFVAGPVCRECGAAGHEEAGCSTPLCERCNLVSNGGTSKNPPSWCCPSSVQHHWCMCMMCSAYLWRRSTAPC
jgi:hypothetical protein